MSLGVGGAAEWLVIYPVFDTFGRAQRLRHLFICLMTNSKSREDGRGRWKNDFGKMLGILHVWE